jgi:hypothetical protein
MFIVRASIGLALGAMVIVAGDFRARATGMTTTTFFGLGGGQ